MSNEYRPRFLGIVNGTNGDGPHGMARYGNEWRRIEPVNGACCGTRTARGPAR